MPDKSPRPRLDSDNAERYQKLSHENGISLESLVNMVLRAAEFMAVSVSNNDQRQQIGKIQQKKQGSRVIMRKSSY